MVQLRKRPAPPTTDDPPTAKRTAAKGSIRSQVVLNSRAEGRAVAEGVTASKGKGKAKGEKAEKDAEEVETKDEAEKGAEGKVGEGAGAATVPLSAESVGKTIGTALGSFGGTVKTHSGEDVTLKGLLEGSEKGIVVFTYPKASTPGCTTQACLFRDSYDPLRAAGLAVYGLSTDSPKANTTFATKQKLPFELLCDPEATLTGALGLKKRVGKGTLRGSVVIGKDGKVESWIQAGPAKTLEVVTAWVEGKK